MYAKLLFDKTMFWFIIPNFSNIFGVFVIKYESLNPNFPSVSIHSSFVCDLPMLFISSQSSVNLLINSFLPGNILDAKTTYLMYI